MTTEQMDQVDETQADAAVEVEEIPAEELDAKDMSTVDSREAPTFNEALQAAVSGFTLAVVALGAGDVAVTNAREQVVSARAQLESAEADANVAATAHNALGGTAITKRDELIGVLQSWTPSA